jgi:cell division protein FtsW (lipid II flippase)
MALQPGLHAKEDRRLKNRAGERVDIPFLVLVLLLLTVGLVMLYSASFAQSEYDTGYQSSTKYLQKQGLCRCGDAQ